MLFNIINLLHLYHIKLHSEDNDLNLLKFLYEIELLLIKNIDISFIFGSNETYLHQSSKKQFSYKIKKEFDILVNANSELQKKLKFSQSLNEDTLVANNETEDVPIKQINNLEREKSTFSKENSGKKEEIDPRPCVLELNTEPKKEEIEINEKAVPTLVGSNENINLSENNEFKLNKNEIIKKNSIEDIREKKCEQKSEIESNLILERPQNEENTILTGNISDNDQGQPEEELKLGHEIIENIEESESNESFQSCFEEEFNKKNKIIDFEGNNNCEDNDFIENYHDYEDEKKNIVEEIFDSENKPNSSSMLQVNNASNGIVDSENKPNSSSMLQVNNASHEIGLTTTLNNDYNKKEKANEIFNAIENKNILEKKDVDSFDDKKELNLDEKSFEKKDPFKIEEKDSAAIDHIKDDKNRIKEKNGNEELEKEKDKELDFLNNQNYLKKEENNTLMADNKNDDKIKINKQKETKEKETGMEKEIEIANIQNIAKNIENDSKVTDHKTDDNTNIQNEESYSVAIDHKSNDQPIIKDQKENEKIEIEKEKDKEIDIAKIQNSLVTLEKIICYSKPESFNFKSLLNFSMEFLKFFESEKTIIDDNEFGIFEYLLSFYDINVEAKGKRMIIRKFYNKNLNLINCEDLTFKSSVSSERFCELNKFYKKMQVSTMELYEMEKYIIQNEKEEKERTSKIYDVLESKTK